MVAACARLGEAAIAVEWPAADLATDREGSGLSAALFAAACGMQFVLPNRTTLRATREAGLVQIALSQVIRFPIRMALSTAAGK